MLRRRLALVFTLATLLSFASISIAVPAEGTLHQAKSAGDFVDSVGVNTHFGYGWTPYTQRSDTPYSDDLEYQTTKRKLAELGVKHIRSGAYINQDSDYFTAKIRQGAFERYRDLYETTGIKTDVWVYWSPGRQEIEQMKLWGGDAIESFEGTNEPDFDSVCSDLISRDEACDAEAKKRELGARVRTGQRDLYEAVKGNPSTADLPVIGPSIVGPGNVDYVLDPDGDGVKESLRAHMDYGNIHSYMWALNPFHLDTNLESRRIPWARDLAGGDPARGKPLVSTETGYNNATNDPRFGGPVSESVAAKYTLRSLFEHFNRGFARTYVYELWDWEPDPERDEAQKNWGLLRNDGTEKPAYTALKNLVGLLEDPGPSFQASSLDYSLSGDTQGVRSTLLQKRDGRFYLVLWHESSSYDRDSQKEIQVPDRRVVLSVNTPVSRASTYLPKDAPEPVGQYDAPGQIVLDVPDHPLVVEFEPSNAQTPAPNTPPSVSALRPAAGARVGDRSPSLTARVRDAETDLRKDDLTLYVDGRERSTFAYNQARDRVVYESGRLSYARHRAKIVARDAQGRETSRTWYFKIVR